MEEDLVLPNVEAADSSDGNALALDELSARAFDEVREAHIPPVKLEITGPVPRLKWGDPRIVSFIDEEKPVIVEQAELAAPAVKRWSVRYLAEHLGDHNMFDVYYTQNNLSFRYYDASKNTGRYAFKNHVKKKQMPFKAFLEKLAENGPSHPGRMYHYFQQTLYEGVGENIARDVRGFDWAWLSQMRIAAQRRLGPIKSNVVWIGPGGVVTPAHFDEAHNFFCQIRGRKRFVLMEPNSFRGMYPFPIAHPCDRQSQVDPYAPDLEHFPKFADVTGVEAILEPGDMLYLPATWWHHVESLTDCIGVNFWLEAAKVDMSGFSLPLRGAQLLSVRRNVEKMLANVMDPKEIGTFLLELAEGRFERCENCDAGEMEEEQ